MQKVRYYLRLSAAFLLRFKGVMLIGVFLGIVGFFVISFVIPHFFATHTTRIGLTGHYSPDNLPLPILDKIGQGLTTISNDRVVEPGLATHWETPDKGKTWVFYLDPDKKWQDGTQVSSGDLNYQFTDVDVEKPDAETVIFKLKDPFAPFPSVVSKPVFRSGFLGTGEWKVSNIALAGSYVQTLTIQNSKEGKIVYNFYPTEERTKLAFKLGHVDQISDIIEPKPLDSWETAQVSKEVKRNQVVTLFFNNEDQLFKDNKTLRQALDYAINKDGFEGERALGPISPDSWVYNPQIKPYNYDTERAHELIDEVKVAEGTEIKLVTTPLLLSVAESIARDWEAVGIKSAVQISSVIPSDFQVYLAILDVPKDPDQYSIWHSTQKDSTNISKFTNHRIDQLLEDGRVELNFEDRRKIYLDFQRFIGEDLPAAFLYHPVTYTIKRK